MVQCYGIKNNSQRCNRQGSKKPEDNGNYCWQHQDFAKSKKVKSNNKTVKTAKINNNSSLTLVSTMKNDSKNGLGPFTGVRSLDKIILVALPDASLKNLMLVNYYFYKFVDYAQLWKEKILNKYGRGRISEYKHNDWFNYYQSLTQNANKYFIPQGVAWTSYLNDKEYKINYGDVIHMNNSAYIYAGPNQLIELDNSQHRFRYSGILPESFYSLTPNNDVIFPLNYWNNDGTVSAIRWLKKNDFKFQPAQFQELSDVDEDGETETIVYAYTEYNCQKYTIFYCKDETMEEDVCAELDEVLSELEYIPVIQRTPHFVNANPNKKGEDYIIGIPLIVDYEDIYNLIDP